jgi:hypothetical protein
MKRIARAGAGLIVLACAARAATAQDISGLIADREASAELAKIVAAVRQNGLPLEPILAKVQYAVMVRAPAPRIVAAARAIAARLEDARAALAPHPTPLDITEGEKALGAGVSAKSLQDVRRVSANKPYLVPLGVLAQLVASKVPEQQATKYVMDLIKRGATADQLAALGNDVNADVTLGRAATSALEMRMNRLNAVLGAPGSNADAATVPTSLQSGDGKKKP